MILKLLTRSPVIWLLALAPLCLAHSGALPEPLTLDAALATADNPDHHQLTAIEQRLAALRSRLGIEQAQSGFSLDFKGRLREVGASDFSRANDDGGDNAASLILSKPLYDFGGQDARENQLALQLRALEHQKQLGIERRRLQIMEHYFAVLNADNRFISENEALAIGFIRYDNALQDQELGLVPELEVLRLQSEYERIRQRRTLAIHQQRLTRALLAETMGYPEQLSSELEVPQIDAQRKLPEDVDALVTRALEYSLEARLAAVSARAAQAEVAIAEADDNATLDLELEISSYERESRLRDDWRAGLYLEIPLYSAAAPARVGLAQARHRLALSEQQQLRSALRLEVLQLWQQVQQLQLQIQGSQVEQDYRDKYLDRSRAEYELEFKTDLGDSMVLYSRSNAERLVNLYALEIAYQRLATLVGAEFLSGSASPE